MRDFINAVSGSVAITESSQQHSVAEDIDMGQYTSAQDNRDKHSGNKASFASQEERDIRNSPAFHGEEGPEKEQEAHAKWKKLRAERLGEEVEDDHEIVQELAGDDDALSGSLDVRALAKLLPEVDRLDPFISAVRKVLRGSIETLTIIERTQLSKGFISLLRDSSEMTVKAMQRLKMVHKDETANEEF